MSYDIHDLKIGELPAELPKVEGLDELIGNTPMLRLSRHGSEDNPVYVKLENTNPSGSIRDRYIAEILGRARRAGQIVAGDTIVLAGINDSAVSAACIGSILRMNTQVFAPLDTSTRLVPIIERYGGVVTISDDDHPLDDCVQHAAKWARESVDRMYVDGYRRSAVRDSYQGIGTEILSALKGIPLGGFVTSVTTGATFREVSRVLRRTNPHLEVRGVRIIENEFATAEENPFIGQIALQDIWEFRDEIARTEGLLLGPKGVACVKRAVELAAELPPGQAVVALNPDSGQRYLGWENKPLFRT